MLVILHGVPWIHIVPAFLAILFGFSLLFIRRMYLKVILGFLWLLELPNTAYIFIDITRFFHAWSMANIFLDSELIFQFLILEMIGLILYILAMLPFERVIDKCSLSKKDRFILIFILNFYIGFGIVLGRWEYINSYVVFTQPYKVIKAGMDIIKSLHLFGLSLLLAMLCNCIYFIFRKIFLNQAKKLIY